MTTVIRQDIDHDIVVWTMDHPTKSANTIDEVFLDDLEACIGRLQSDATLKGAVITSAKSLFLAGADLKDMERGMTAIRSKPVAEVFEAVFRFSRLLRELETCGRPVACAITGTVETARLAPYRPTVVRDSRSSPVCASVRNTLTASVCAACPV